MQYTVRGSDGADYGPVDLQTLKSWAADGRVFPDTLITDGLTNRQAPAKDFSELGLAAPASFTSTIEPPRGQTYQGTYSVPNDRTRLWATIGWLALAIVLATIFRYSGIFVAGFNAYNAYQAKVNDDKYGNLGFAISVVGFLGILGWTYIKYTTGTPVR